jgi:hypothetical protein
MTKQAINVYKKNRPQKAKIIKKAINRGMREYEETFRRLASA